MYSEFISLTTYSLSITFVQMLCQHGLVCGKALSCSRTEMKFWNNPTPPSRQ